ncbi:aldolase catalytic domain-containing protein [Collinsella ihumii]|uniref:aldolase catalytic domain-containing protein n=1 Tax=Collinsella ihumii TaxID=1720204 RepID=UPI000830AAEB|nr:aldolase catalytic domain-containing protein [Collinsella ihumii]
MGNVRILDCTLRDGGYCNGWEFGVAGSRAIARSLVEAGVDIIECGFLTDRVRHHEGSTRFNTVEGVGSIIPADRGSRLFVAMANYGELDADALPECDGSSIGGIRVAFSKRDRFEALEMCREIKEKGYLVFIQAMVSLSYTDEEFLDLIRRVNEIGPYAFYIVDSFGVMKRRDMLRLFYLTDHNLAEGIPIGFHSHNNMQLAYSNAQTLVDMRPVRDLIIDSSIYGMGRGAGNLCTELFVDYLNDGYGGAYDLRPLLKVIDDVVGQFYYRRPWGYSLPNFLSASHSAHPNYAGWLADKDTLTIGSVNDIFDMMDEEHRLRFDKAYIEDLYDEYMSARGGESGGVEGIRELLKGKRALVICPGKSSDEESDLIADTVAQADTAAFSVNFFYPHATVDVVFASNMRRCERLPGDLRGSKLVVTSNIDAPGAYAVVDYSSLLNGEEPVRDNAALMLVRLLISLGVDEILLAGMDGYSPLPEENYSGDRVSKVVDRKQYEEINRGMSRVLGELVREADIRFLTTPRYVTVGEDD